MKLKFTIYTQTQSEQATWFFGCFLTFFSIPLYKIPPHHVLQGHDGSNSFLHTPLPILGNYPDQSAWALRKEIVNCFLTKNNIYFFHQSPSARRCTHTHQISLRTQKKSGKIFLFSSHFCCFIPIIFAILSQFSCIFWVS